jgi:Fe-S oxidoreductase
VAGRLLPSVGTPKPGNGRTQQPRVALFYTCSVNYHYPEIGEAAVRVLKRNGVEVILPDQVCCGMPFVDIGDIPSILKKAERNIRSLKQAIDRGYDVVAVMPSCSLMLKKEFPSLLGDEDSKEVSRHTYDLCEYLMKLHDAGNLSLDFKSAMGKIIYQVPCHLRDQNIGYKSRDLMQLIPGTSVEIIERCSGHDGTWGIKTEYFEESMKIAGRIFRKVEETAPDRVTTDCPLAGNQITQGTGHEVLHPVQILAMAYGEQEI